MLKINLNTFCLYFGTCNILHFSSGTSMQAYAYHHVFCPIFYPVKKWMLTSEVMLMYSLWKQLLLCYVAAQRFTWWRTEGITRVGEAVKECHFSCSQKTAVYLDGDWSVVVSHVSLGLMYTRLWGHPNSGPFHLQPACSASLFALCETRISLEFYTKQQSLLRAFY